MEYKNVDEFILCLQGGDDLCDIIKIDGVEYTQVNYDSDGKLVQYHTGGIQAKYSDIEGTSLDVITSDRYNKVYSDVVIEIY